MSFFENQWGFKNYLFLGLGLIGGSMARAIRTLQPDAQITAYVRRPEKLKKALEDGIINALSETVTSDVSKADLIILCAPTLTNSDNLQKIAPFVQQETLITDVGSVKQDIQKSADALGISAQFLGGHPMAGKEKSGYESADATLLEKASYILTPSGTRPELSARFSELVRAMKANVLITDPEYHDRAVAAVSHLPHLIAASLVVVAKENDNEDAFLKTIAAGGFKDITRIASSDPEVWAAICESNVGNIRDLLSQYMQKLEETETALKDGDYEKIRCLFREAGTYRGSIH